MKYNKHTTIVFVVLLALIVLSSSTRTYDKTTIHAQSHAKKTDDVDVKAEKLAGKDRGGCWQCWVGGGGVGGGGRK
ncbi:hypothetical protein R6Q59_029901 [Mikania micrantha]